MQKFPSRFSSHLFPKLTFGGDTLPAARRRSSAAWLSFYKSNPGPPRRLPAPGLQLPAELRLLRQTGRCCFKSRLPPPPSDNGLNRALLPKAKFAICHFSDGRFSFRLLTEPREDAELRPRQPAGARSGRAPGHRVSELLFSSRC